MVLKFYFKQKTNDYPLNMMSSLLNTKSSKSDEFSKKSFRCALIKISNIINNSDFVMDIFDKLYAHSLQGYSHHVKTNL